MKMKLIILLLVSTAVLIGCGEEEPTRTVEYYLQHESERKSKISYCNESANRQTETNCINAHDAQAKKDIKTMLNEGIPRSKQ